MTKRVFIYARRSDKSKKWTSISIDDQKTALIKECKKKWFIIDKIIEENQSWFVSWRREKFNDMIKELKERNIRWKWNYIDYVFIKKPNRISRNDEDTKLIIDLLDKEIVGLYSLSDWETSSLMSMQKLEKDLIDAKYESKVKSAEWWIHMDEATKNVWTICITPPYWYKRIWSKDYWKIVHNYDNDEANVVKEIFEEYSTGKYTISSMVNHLNLKYRRTKKLKWETIFCPYNYDFINNLLKNERYCWIYKHTFNLTRKDTRQYFKEEYPEINIKNNKITIDYTDIIKDFWTFEPLISKYLFNVCQKLKWKTINKKINKKVKENDYIFKWILICNCKKETEKDRYKWLKFTWEKTWKNKKYDNYKCNNNNAKLLKCYNPWMSWKKVENLFLKKFIDWIKFSELEIGIFENIISKQLESLIDIKEDNSKIFQDKLKNLKSQKSKYMDSYIEEDDIDFKKDIKEKINKIKKDIETTENELEKISEIDTKNNIQKRQIEDYIFYISSLWEKFESFPKFRKKELLEAMFEYVVLVDQKIAEYKLNPVFEFAFNKKKFDVSSISSKKKLKKTSNNFNSLNKVNNTVSDLNFAYGIPDKDRTCVYPLGGGYSSTELQRLKKFLKHNVF